MTVENLSSTPMTNQQKTAQKVTEFLEGHPKVASEYPGLESSPIEGIGAQTDE